MSKDDPIPPVGTSTGNPANRVIINQPGSGKPCADPVRLQDAADKLNIPYKTLYGWCFRVPQRAHAERVDGKWVIMPKEMARLAYDLQTGALKYEHRNREEKTGHRQMTDKHKRRIREGIAAAKAKRDAGKKKPAAAPPTQPPTQPPSQPPPEPVVAVPIRFPKPAFATDADALSPIITRAREKLDQCASFLNDLDALMRRYFS